MALNAPNHRASIPARGPPQSRPFPLDPRSRETANGPEIRYLRTDEWPQNSPILDRGLAWLTTHSPSSTILVDEKGRLFFLYSQDAKLHVGTLFQNAHRVRRINRNFHKGKVLRMYGESDQEQW